MCLYVGRLEQFAHLDFIQSTALHVAQRPCGPSTGALVRRGQRGSSSWSRVGSNQEVQIGGSRFGRDGLTNSSFSPPRTTDHKNTQNVSENFSESESNNCRPQQDSLEDLSAFIAAPSNFHGVLWVKASRTNKVWSQRLRRTLDTGKREG